MQIWFKSKAWYIKGYGTILSYGEYIEILEPSHIREIIKEKSKKIFEKYL
jgi:predicted DNA-binding transcriptional regulator YafY